MSKRILITMFFFSRETLFEMERRGRGGGERGGGRGGGDGLFSKKLSPRPICIYLTTLHL
jgi:hypothetical protein